MAVQFDEQYSTPNRSRVHTTFISRLIIGTGLAKTERGAQVLLLVIFVAVVVLIFFSLRANPLMTPQPPTAEQIIP